MASQSQLEGRALEHELAKDTRYGGRAVRMKGPGGFYWNTSQAAACARATMKPLAKKLVAGLCQQGLTLTKADVQARCPNSPKTIAIDAVLMDNASNRMILAEVKWSPQRKTIFHSHLSGESFSGSVSAKAFGLGSSGEGFSRRVGSGRANQSRFYLGPSPRGETPEGGSVPEPRSSPDTPRRPRQAHRKQRCEQAQMQTQPPHTHGPSLGSQGQWLWTSCLLQGQGMELRKHCRKPSRTPRSCTGCWRESHRSGCAEDGWGVTCPLARWPLWVLASLLGNAILEPDCGRGSCRASQWYGSGLAGQIAIGTLRSELLRGQRPRPNARESESDRRVSSADQAGSGMTTSAADVPTKTRLVESLRFDEA